MKYLRFVKTKWFLAAACVLLGAVIVLGIRFVTYKSDKVHYHANFALYVNGKREQFKGAQYYSETEMCAVNESVTPTERAHMHDNINNVVHVEDQAVTWGQFFTNLGWTLGSTFVASPDGTVYTENGSSKLHIVINGQDYTDLGSIANREIKDEDRLLVSFGDVSNATLKQQYNAIPATAHSYDTQSDPKSCSGSEHSTLRDRMRHMF